MDGHAEGHVKGLQHADAHAHEYGQKHVTGHDVAVKTEGKRKGFDELAENVQREHERRQEPAENILGTSAKMMKITQNAVLCDADPLHIKENTDGDGRDSRKKGHRGILKRNEPEQVRN